MSREAMQQALEVLCVAREFTELYDTEHAAWVNEKCHEAMAALRAALAEQAHEVKAEPLKGWKLNHVQFERGSGTAQIGYLDPEDDRFSPIVTVDTGLYYQPHQAHPLAVAILAVLADRTGAELAQPVADAARVIEWATSTPRKAAVHAFTEGPERQAAYWIEWAEARVVNRRLTTEQAQPVAWMCTETKVLYDHDTSEVDKYHGFKPTVPLYTTPPAPVVPPGWKLVPVEPTREMMHAAFELPLDQPDWLRLRYRAMVTAAPEAPSPPAPQPLADEDIHLITGHCGVSKHAAISIARAVEAEVLKRMGVQR